MTDQKKQQKKDWRQRALGGAVTFVIATAAVIGFFSLPHEKSEKVSLIDSEVLASYEKRDASGIDVSHVASGVTPPTNTWFSGLALQQEPQAVYAYPNSYQMKPEGVQLGLPKVEVLPDAVQAKHRAGANVTIRGATSYKVVRHDELSVDVAYYGEAKRELAVATFMAGVPVVPIVATEATTVEVELERALVIQSQGVGGAEDQWFGVQQADGRPRIENERIVSKLKAGQFASIYTAPTRDALDVVAEYALNRPMNATVEYRKTNKRVTTKLSVRTANNQPTVMTLLPHHEGTEMAALAEYASQFGPMKLIEMRSFSYSAPVVAVDSTVSLAAVSDEDRGKIAAQLQRDIDATRLDATDPEVGGQQLYRAAQLLALAQELGQTESATTLRQKLNVAFEEWLDPASARGFYYDTVMKGMVAKQASAQAKAFDGHHYSYGYFLSAAAVLGQYDSSFVERHAKAMNLLAADIATYQELDEMPVRRNYDPYVGHSWQSGAAPYADGNRQTSSAAAINAWTGTVLWAQASGNKQLEEQAHWMLANESASAKRYWTNITIAGYDHASFGTIWGAKREWDVGMAAAPNAPVGLQLQPMTPTLANIYRSNKEVLTSLLDQSELSTGARFSDGMYLADVLRDAADVRESWRRTNVVLEDSTSMTYLMAFVASEAAKNRQPSQ